MSHAKLTLQRAPYGLKLGLAARHEHKVLPARGQAVHHRGSGWPVGLRPQGVGPKGVDHDEDEGPRRRRAACKQAPR